MNIWDKVRRWSEMNRDIQIPSLMIVFSILALCILLPWYFLTK